MRARVFREAVYLLEREVVRYWVYEVRDEQQRIRQSGVRPTWRGAYTAACEAVTR